MKVLASKGIRQLKATAYYTGTSGTYASAQPTAETSQYIQQCCEKASWMGFKATGPLDQHTTVIHSKKGLDWQQQHDLWMNGFNASRVFDATVKGFTHWAGHNDKGYVVMEIDCPELQLVNAWLRKTYDLPVSFDEYRPHVTIVEDAYVNSVAYAEQLIEELNKIPKPLSMAFTGLRVEDLK
jgi:hypothetical protein